MHVSIPPKSDNLVDGGVWSLGVESFVRLDGPSSRADLGFRFVGIGFCSVEFSEGIPTETWGASTEAGGCSSCPALRLSLFRLHSTCVDLFSAFELYLSIRMNLQWQYMRGLVDAPKSPSVECKVGNLMRADRESKKVGSRATAVALPIRPTCRCFE